MGEFKLNFKGNNRITFLATTINTQQGQGKSTDEIKSIIVDKNATQCDPPLTDAELTDKIFPLIEPSEAERATDIKNIIELVTQEQQQITSDPLPTFTGEDRFTQFERIAKKYKDYKTVISVPKMQDYIRRYNELVCKPVITDPELELCIFPFLYDTDEKGEIIKPPLSLKDAEEKPISWVIQNYIVQGELNILAADGGVGKSTVAISMAIGVASGCDTFFQYASTLKPVLDLSQPVRKPRNVLIYTGEDSVSKVLKRRAKEGGASDETLGRILCRDVEHDDLSRYTFDSPLVGKDIEDYKPGLVIFDPVQEFVGDSVNMGSRNQMSTILNKLCRHGEKYGTAFLIVVHTNKRGQGASGRYRMADSSELWDRPRSVLIMGNTGEVDNEGNAIKYISCEKSNYCKRPPTVLITLKNGTVQFVNTNYKTDDDYVHKFENSKKDEKSKPQRDNVKRELVKYLESRNGEAPTSDLNSFLNDALGFSKKTIERAKTELSEESTITYKKKGTTWLTLLAK